MKSSICITVFNEEKSISNLLNSLFVQTQKPDEIIVVDGGSTDKTVETIKRLQGKHGDLKLYIKKCNRAQGRNLSVRKAKYEIIAMTDADCAADKHWLEKITKPFKDGKTEMVAGFYKMMGESDLQNALAIFIGVTPNKFNKDTFLPSTRSIAFKRGLWERVGGFPEGEDNSAEDTDFNYLVVKQGVKITRVKNAIVFWNIPDSLKLSLKKFYDYAKWDAKRGFWKHPLKNTTSHNIHVLTIFVRYLIGVLFLLLSFDNPLFLGILMAGLLIYSARAFYKVFVETKRWVSGLWGIVLQFTTDFTIMAGFINGLIF